MRNEKKHYVKYRDYYRGYQTRRRLIDSNRLGFLEREVIRLNRCLEVALSK